MELRGQREHENQKNRGDYQYHALLCRGARGPPSHLKDLLGPLDGDERGDIGTGVTSHELHKQQTSAAGMYRSPKQRDNSPKESAL